MEKTKIFGVVMDSEVREALKRLAAREHLSGSAVIRRLVWQELERLPGAEIHYQEEQLQCA